ncbi:MAG: translation elongation factor-like protein [Anaerolineae bacterium]
MPEKAIGKVSHYFTRISVAAIELTDQLAVGDTIHILGRSTDFEQTVDSMEIEHQAVESAGAGQSVGVKVVDRVRAGDVVYKVEQGSGE